MDMSPKTRKRAARRNPARAKEIIIEAAAEVFNQKGFHRATVDDIAEASGYAPASVYKYFHGKEELLFGLWQLTNSRLSRILDEVDAMPPTFEVRLRWFSVKLTRLIEEDRTLLLAFMSMYPTPSTEGMTEPEIDAVQENSRNMRRVSEMMQRGMKEGTLQAGDAFDYAVAFMSLFRGCAFHWYTTQNNTPLSSRMAMTVDIFLKGTRAPKVTKAPEAE